MDGAIYNCSGMFGELIVYLCCAAFNSLSARAPCRGAIMQLWRKEYAGTVT